MNIHQWCILLALASPAAATPASIPVTIREYPLPAGSGPGGFPTGPDGALWFTEYYYDQIGRITLAGAITSFRLTPGSNPNEIAIGPDGALWFTEAGSNQIGRITTAGAISEYPIPTANSFPNVITAGPDGALWFIETAANQIGRISTAGAITEFPIPTAASTPIGITAGPDGALWFAEQDGNRIGRISTAGAIAEFPIPTSGSSPQYVAKGPDGALWFTEENGNQIGRITTAGAIVEYPIPTSGSAPIGITAGPDGALWFTENAGNQIGRITTSGAIAEYPIPTPDSQPYDISAGPDGALWFAEQGGDQIGRAIPTLPASGTVTVTLATSPAGLAVTVDGATVATPQSFHWAAGQMHAIGAPPPQPAGPATRYAFASWSDGGAPAHNITVPSAAATYTGTFATQFLLTTLPSPLDRGVISAVPSSTDGFYNSGASVQLTATGTGGAPFTGWNGDLSGIVNPQSVSMSAPRNVVANFAGAALAPSITEYTIPSGSYPTRIAAGPDGALWFTETADSKIGRITTAGVVTEYTGLTANSNPVSITTGPDGALWFTEFFGNAIGRITTAGAVTEFRVTSANSNPTGIAPGPDGALWFTESTGDQIGRITIAGLVTNEYLAPTPGGVPQGIATGPDGAMWFTEAAGNKIGRITMAGTITEYPVPTSGSSPGAIATGPDGALWFTESTGNNIGRISTAGVITEYALPSSFSNPQGITTGPDGALWFTESGSNRIGRITTAGAISEYAIPTARSGAIGIGTIGSDGALWFAEAQADKIGRVAVPTGAPCTYSLPQASLAFAPGGGNGTAVVRTQAPCSWAASSNGFPWVTIAAGAIGLGNGPVSYTVAANPASVPRTATLIIANQPYAVTQAGNAGAPSCTGSVPSAPQVALEGRTEVLGDFLLSCSGLGSGLKADITLTLNANVTNLLVNGVTDAVLTVNGGAPQSGLIAAYNSIRWPGVSLAPAGGGTATVRISKVRAEASLTLTQGIVATPGTPRPTAITGQVSIIAPVAVQVTGAVATMANAAQSLIFSKGAPTGGTQTSIPVMFQEAAAAGFQAGATRLRVALANLPATAQVYAPVFPAEGNTRAQLYSADANGFGGSPVAGGSFAGGTYQPLVVSGGSVTATWVVLAADPNQVETFTFPLLVLNGGDPAQLQLSGSLAPVSDVRIASATAPVPRYRDFSVQQKLSNLRISTAVQVQGAAGSLKAAVRTQAEMPVPLSVDVGSNVTFNTQVVNDTTDPSQTATNVVVRDNLPSGLVLVNCAAPGGSCTGSGNQVQVNYAALGPGQGGDVTVVARVADSSDSGGTLENPVSATSDQANLDLMASTSSASLIVGGTAVVVGGSTSGFGSSQSFTFQFSDPAGYQRLGVVDVLINSSLDGRNACYLAYSVASTTLYLVDDAGQAGGPYAGTLPLGSPVAIQNSQCSVSQFSALGSGPTLTLTMNIAFAPAFGGNKIVYVAAQGQGNSGWQVFGIAQTPSAPAGTIAVSGLTPAGGGAPAGANQQFTLTLTDSKGTGDFGIVNLLINDSLDGRQACYLAYAPSTDTLMLVDDNGDAGGPFAGSMALNRTTAGIENEQCAVNGSRSTVALAPYTMTLTLSITFKPTFRGNQVFYAAGRDQADGNSTGWQAVGTWSVQ